MTHETVMFGSKDDCDVEITDNQNHKFYLQSFMLQLRSGVFRNIERDNQRLSKSDFVGLVPKHEPIVLDYSTDAVRCFLEMVYSNNVADTKIPETCMIEVWKLCFQYETVDSILKKCESTIIEHIPTNVDMLIGLANVSTSFHSESIMSRCFILFTQPHGLSSEKLNKMFWEFKDAYLSHLWTPYESDSKRDNHNNSSSETSIVFFGTEADCDVVFLSASKCKFHIHRLLLEMKSETFREQPVELTYSTNACKIVFGLLYANDFPSVPCNLMSESLAMLLDFKMIHYTNCLILKIGRHIEDLAIDDCVAIANLVTGTAFDRLLKMLYQHISQPGTLTTKAFKKLTPEFKNAYLVHLCVRTQTIIDVPPVEARDKKGHWYIASIIERIKTLVKVHYFGWDDKWDEWICENDVCPMGTRAIKAETSVICKRGKDQVRETQTLLFGDNESESSDSD